MSLKRSKLILAVLCACGSTAGIYSFVYFDDPRHAASCEVADYIVVSVGAIGGLIGLIKYVILRHPVPTLRSFFGGPDP
jgi:hypothetical protein